MEPPWPPARQLVNTSALAATSPEPEVRVCVEQVRAFDPIPKAALPWMQLLFFDPSHIFRNILQILEFACGEERLREQSCILRLEIIIAFGTNRGVSLIK